MNKPKRKTKQDDDGEAATLHLMHMLYDSKQEALMQANAALIQAAIELVEIHRRGQHAPLMRLFRAVDVWQKLTQD